MQISELIEQGGSAVSPCSGVGRHMWCSRSLDEPNTSKGVGHAPTNSPQTMSEDDDRHVWNLERQESAWFSNSKFKAVYREYQGETASFPIPSPISEASRLRESNPRTNNQSPSIESVRILLHHRCRELFSIFHLSRLNHLTEILEILLRPL
jgi:hypothetical protein